MADVKAKGSILYEIFIVILILGLVATILYPKAIWKGEEERTSLCRERMEHLLRAELLYISEYNTYTDSLPELVDFVLGDTTLARLRNYKMVDSTLAAEIIDHAQDYMAKSEIISAIRAALDSMESDTVAVDYLDLERYEQRYPDVPLEQIIGDWKAVADTVLVDTLTIPIPLKHVLDVGADLVTNKEIIQTLWFIAIDMYDEERPQAWVLNVLEYNPIFVTVGDSLAAETIKSFSVCPTTGDSMIVTVVDTSVIKEVHIACPIDSLDVVEFKKDFLRSRIGGLTIKNHGRIDNGEKNWKGR